MKTNLLILLLFFITNFSFTQSFNEVKKSAEQGYAKAQFNLGQMYENGLGTLIDKKQSFYWYKKSAKQGYGEAQFNLGGMYNKGKGTLTDKKQAFYWYKKSAEQGDAMAQFNLGVMYDNGEDTLTDYKQAFYWYKKSAEQGYSKAQYNLGIMYDNGEGTLTDKKQAFYWYKKCAEQGDAKAQYNIGVMYFNGEGTLTNKSKCASWIRVSYENGFEQANDFWDKFELYKYWNRQFKRGIKSNERKNKAFPEKNLSKIINSNEIQEYIAILSEITNVSSADLLEVRKGGNNKSQGTWAQQKVALRISQKLSSEFAIQVDTHIERTY